MYKLLTQNIEVGISIGIVVIIGGLTLHIHKVSCMVSFTSTILAHIFYFQFQAVSWYCLPGSKLFVCKELHFVHKTIKPTFLSFQVHLIISMLRNFILEMFLSVWDPHVEFPPVHGWGHSIFSITNVCKIRTHVVI